MVDTGCRSAVGGTEWHRQFQRELTSRGIPYHSEPQSEFFQFGPGEPILSQRRWCYNVGVLGRGRRLDMSEVPVTCPGLVGPDELASWSVILNFETGTMSSEGCEEPLLSSSSGHPCVDLMNFRKPEQVFPVRKIPRTPEASPETRLMRTLTSPEASLGMRLMTACRGW